MREAFIFWLYYNDVQGLVDRLPSSSAISFPFCSRPSFLSCGNPTFLLDPFGDRSVIPFFASVCIFSFQSPICLFRPGFGNRRGEKKDLNSSGVSPSPENGRGTNPTTGSGPGLLHEMISDLSYFLFCAGVLRFVLHWRYLPVLRNHLSLGLFSDSCKRQEAFSVSLNFSSSPPCFFLTFRCRRDIIFNPLPQFLFKDLVFIPNQPS